MDQKAPIAIAMVLLATASAAVAIASQPLQDEDPLPSADKFAAQSVVMDQVLEQSRSVRAARERCGDCYIGDGGNAEIVIGLLGMGGAATTDSLLNLLTVQLDAGLAESRSCELAKRGKSLVPALKRFDSTTAAEWCATTFNRLRQHELSKVNDVSVAQICRPSKEIEADRKSWIASLRSGEDLLAESGPC
jgi:hypothetical protein